MDILKKSLDRGLYWITVVLFALLVLVVVWQVFSRQVAGSPATWTEEGARLTFVWLGLFASAFVFGERGHIAVEFLARKLPSGAERLLSVLVQVVVLTFSLVVLIWGGWRASQNAWNQELSALPFTVGQMYLALPVTGVLITFYALYYIQALVREAEPPYPDTSDEDDPQVQVTKYTDRSTILPSTDDPRKGK
ncbi:TRAP transporter small permease [Nesterenkonia sp. PF2B19]|uniref:TRAP transporter small permease n=1 Tax=unclassified Nesterenkonia TaxID=2629769 RepID=UPI00087249EE|nr:TRAP transporter small permease [Nesterenkonia sp. PF2B19]OSM44016.1 C4-dicarboxylate ABC transporter permease [Nesterenkonia sp. PF2B19]